MISDFYNWGSRKQSDITWTAFPSDGGAVSHNSFHIFSKSLLPTYQKLPNFQQAPEGSGEAGIECLDGQIGEQSHLQNLRPRTRAASWDSTEQGKMNLGVLSSWPWQVCPFSKPDRGSAAVLLVTILHLCA